MKNKRCVVIGASPETDARLIREMAGEDDFIACADGGYIFAEKAGLSPDIIIGDFDSSEHPGRPGCEVITLPVRKDDTDTMYVLKECLCRGFVSFLLLGMTGGSPDHTFANITALSFLCEHGAVGTIADKNGLITVRTAGTMTIQGRTGARFSIFPFGCGSCTVTLRGFSYELDSGTLNESFPLGVSNCITDDNAMVRIESGKALIYF